MHKYYLLFLGVVAVCFLGCSKDKAWVEIKKEANKLNMVKISKSTYEKNCKSVQSKIETARNKRSSSILNSIGDIYLDSLGNFDFYKLSKDSLGLFCDEASIRAKYGPYNIKVFLENSRNMDGYINGKTNFKRDVSELLHEIASINEGSKQVLYHINNKINEKYSDGKIDEIIKKLSYWDFKDRGGDTASRKFIMFKKMIDTALSEANDSSLSIIISNFNISKDNSCDSTLAGCRPEDYIKYVREVSGGIRNSLKRHHNLSLLVLRQESDFWDCYYDINEKCYIDSHSNEGYVKECIPREQSYRYAIAMQNMCEEQEKERNCYKKEPRDIEVWNASGREAVRICANSKSRIKINTSFLRPYFVWILGTNQQIEQVLKTPFFTKKSTNDSLWLAKYIRNNSELKFKKLEIIPDKENKSVNMQEFVYYSIHEDSINVIRAKDDSKLEIPIRLNFGMVAEILPEIYKDSINYILNDQKHYSIKNVKELSKNNSNKWTHSLVVDMVQNDESITAPILKDTPFLLTTINVERESWVKNHSWIAKYSSETDTLFADISKTNGNYNAKQTRGLKILLENVYNAFYEQPLDSFKIKIGVGK